MALNDYLQNAAVSVLSEQRKAALQPLIDYVVSCRQLDLPVQLNFICTHNSRRSHLALIWAQVWAQHWGIEKVYCYSGGTEATAFNLRAVAALQRAGLTITTQDWGAANPPYQVQLPLGGTLICFSKKYDDSTNPSSDFAAIMTCTEADAACPNVHGASVRISLPYHDPKEADNTPYEQSRYDERCLQIASEMAYVFEQVKSLDL